MTLRMVVQPEKGAALLALHGWLSGPEVSEFERVATGAPLPLRIDLSNLAGADQKGLVALRAQRERGASLVNASPYISILMEGQGEADPARSPSRRTRRSGPSGPAG